MKRWDRLVDGYIEGVPGARDRRGDDQPHRCTSGSMGPMAQAASTARADRAHRCGADHALHRQLLELSSHKATVYGTLSTMRGFGDFLVREGLLVDQLPLRWMKGPKVTPYSRLPKRIDQAHLQALWTEAARRGGEYGAHLWVTVLSLLYGTGLRRGEHPERPPTWMPLIALRGHIAASMGARVARSVACRCRRWCCVVLRRIFLGATTSWSALVSSANELSSWCPPRADLA